MIVPVLFLLAGCAAPAATTVQYQPAPAHHAAPHEEHKSNAERELGDIDEQLQQIEERLHEYQTSRDRIGQ